MLNNSSTVSGLHLEIAKKKVKYPLYNEKIQGPFVDDLFTQCSEIYLISRILNPVNVTDAKNLCIFLKEFFDIRQKQFNVG
jgi:hypothetical protein